MIETLSVPHTIHRGEVLYEDPYQKLYRVVAEFDGFTKQYAVSERGIRAGLLAIHQDQVLLARQYRLLANEVTLEIPGGAVEPGEDPAVAARRECLEETGVECHDLRPLVVYDPSLDILDNKTHIFYSEQCLDQGHGDLNRYVWVPLARCLEQIFSHQLTDVLTLVAILGYVALTKGQR
jgi:ADP-ribose diphosphatase